MRPNEVLSFNIEMTVRPAVDWTTKVAQVTKCKMAAKKASKKKEDLDALLQEATSLLVEKEVSRKRKEGLSVWNFIGTSLLF